MCKFTNHESIQIGAGMVSRGEVALIVATKGAALGLMSSVFFGPVIIMVVATTIVAPILLKLAFRNDKGGDTPVPPEDQLKTNYQVLTSTERLIVLLGQTSIYELSEGIPKVTK